MPQVKVLPCSVRLLLAAFLSASSCDNSHEQSCYDCGPCYGDDCKPPPLLNGPGGAAAFDGTGGLQLNLGSTDESAGGETSASGETSTGGARP